MANAVPAEKTITCPTEKCALVITLMNQLGAHRKKFRIQRYGRRYRY